MYAGALRQYLNPSEVFSLPGEQHHARYVRGTTSQPYATPPKPRTTTTATDMTATQTMNIYV